MRRREFIEISTKTLGGFLLYTLMREPMYLNAATEGKVRVPLRFFTARQAQTIAAASERIFPSDESGPGAREAGVVIFIDRQLAGPYGRDEYRYTKGPWTSSVPENGYQGKENPQETYRAGIQTLGEDFADLAAAGQDERLRAIEHTRFFQMLRKHTIEGMFSDPLHGGNVNMIGWQLIGFPGPRLSYREQIGKYNGRAWREKPESLAQMLGRPVKGWEDKS